MLSSSKILFYLFLVGGGGGAFWGVRHPGGLLNLVKIIVSHLQ